MENTKRLYLMERYTLQHGEVAPGSYRDRRISLSDICRLLYGKRLRNGLFFFVSEDRIRHICMPYK